MSAPGDGRVRLARPSPLCARWRRWSFGVSWSHLLLALSVVAIWGTNFVVIRWGLDGLPPFLFATLRFALSALPWLLFIRRPAVPLRKLAAFGVLLGVGQFGLLYLAIQGRITPGLASLVVQMQVFFTIGLSVVLMGERVRPYQLAGMALAVSGLAVIASHLDATLTVTGLALVLAAAFFWSCANLLAKSAGRVDMLAFMVWSSLFAVPPLFALSWWLEGPALMASRLQAASPGVWATVLWQAIGNSLYGYGVWNWLLARHPAATVTPLALLVPVFGMGASTVFLGEPLPAWKLGAGALVLGGLAVIVLWPHAAAALRQREAA
jgi:O-acetylserine/cysteine efflux transporter